MPRRSPVAAKRCGLLKTVYETNGEKYTGEWKDDLREGTRASSSGVLRVCVGVLVCCSGRSDPIPHLLINRSVRCRRRPQSGAAGKGTCITKSNTIYDGDWIAGNRQGFGVRSVIRKGKHAKEYSGGWVNNKKQGYGANFYANGDTFEGEWFEGMRSGWGRHAFANGDVYEGDFRENKMHGKGKFTYADGNVYEGDFRENKMHGKGKFTYASGNAYEGDFRDNKMHDSRAKFTFASGQVKYGEYANDARIRWL